nr:uncharacterized protein LOC109163473 [Ipomoea batatas]
MLEVVTFGNHVGGVNGVEDEMIGDEMGKGEGVENKIVEKRASDEGKKGNGEKNLGHVKEILGLKGRTMLFKISAKKEHYVRRNIPFPVVKIKTDQLLLQQLCPDLLALDENEFNSDGPSSEGDDKFLELIGVHLAKKSFSRHGNGPAIWVRRVRVQSTEYTVDLSTVSYLKSPINGDFVLFTAGFIDLAVDSLSGFVYID